MCVLVTSYSIRPTLITSLCTLLAASSFSFRSMRDPVIFRLRDGLLHGGGCSSLREGWGEGAHFITAQASAHTVCPLLFTCVEEQELTSI